jgi:hypothetical protein
MTNLLNHAKDPGRNKWSRLIYMCALAAIYSVTADTEARRTAAADLLNVTTKSQLFLLYTKNGGSTPDLHRNDDYNSKQALCYSKRHVTNG